MISGVHGTYSLLSYLGWRTWKTKAVSQGLSGSLYSLLLAIQGERLEGKAPSRSPSQGANIAHHSLVPFASKRKLHALEIPILLHSSSDLASQGHSLPWMGMRAGAAPLGWVCLDLQRSLFPSEPSKHDPLLSQAIPPSPHWWVSKLLKFPSPDALRRWPGLCLALLWTVQGHRWGEEGGRRSIYQDVLLYFFYPSPGRWFYFSENPLNSDQVRWLLSLETQELSGHNRYKCWTPKARGGPLGQWWSSGGPFQSFLGF